MISFGWQFYEVFFIIVLARDVWETFRRNQIWTM